jgi:hypothetical protein
MELYGKEGNATEKGPVARKLLDLAGSLPTP